MAIFRGTGGSGSSSDSTIVDAVTAQATIATTKRDEAEGFRDEAEGFKNTASSAATTATTKASEASVDAVSADIQRQACVVLRGETYDLAVDALASANAAEASATTANSSAVQTVAGSNTQVVGVYNNIANVNTVAGVNTDVTTVAGISSDVTTVAADASDIGTVSTNIANVNNVGNNIANVNAVHGNASNINTVAADGTDIGTVATNIANVNTVAGISSTVTTVAGLESKMDTVIADASDIGAVAGNIGDVTTVAGINADVDTVAGIAAKVTTVADNISDVQNADTNATNAATSASNASASATSASNSATTATTKATEASNSATAANNSATTATTKASQAAGSATTAGTSASTATTKASEASASATTATTKAGEAASSASAASGDATTATTKAAEADASATSAATSATNSSNAASTWNNFYNSYLGVADAQPSVDVLGNAIVAGALYYDTGAGSNTVGLYVYNGSTWVYSTNYNNVTAPYSLAQDLATNGNDISFGDNDKAKFGASDDLQIFHTGSYSAIRDVGTGGLFIGGENYVDIGNAGASETYARFHKDAQVDLYHNNSVKLATTATGIDVTGTATMDGLTVTSGSSSDNIMQVFGGGTIYAGLGVDGTGAVLTAGSTGSADSDLIIKTSSSGTEKQRARFQDNGDVSFYEDTGTTPKFFWDASAERLGIGTSSPEKKLHVEGDVRIKSAFPRLYLTDTDSNSDYSIINNNGKFSIYDDTNTDYRMVIDSSGRVGIGTASPAQELHVVSSGESDIRLQGSGSANHLDIFHNASDFGLWGTGTQQLKLATNNTERLRIDSSGNVGIGTSEPSHKLHVSGSNSAARFSDDGTGFSLDIEHDTANGITTLQQTNSGGDLRLQGGSASGLLLFETASAERMRIDSSGNVRIGTVLPQTSAKFNLRRNGTNIEFGHGNRTSGYYGTLGSQFNNGQPYMGFSCDADDSGNTFTTRGFKGNALIGTTTGDLTFNQLTSASASGQTPTERMRIDSSGNLLVGKTSQAYATAGLELEGAGRVVATRDGASAGIFARLNSDGDIVNFRKGGTTVGSISVTASATAYNTSSDERLKENIQDAEDAGSKIDAIQVRQFDWKSDGSHQDYGVIAQELVEVAPEAVTEGETEDEMMSVDYSKLVPTLIKEIQTLRNRVAQLENN